mgnify:CR=1 FL=1
MFTGSIGECTLKRKVEIAEKENTPAMGCIYESAQRALKAVVERTARLA